MAMSLAARVGRPPNGAVVATMSSQALKLLEPASIGDSGKAIQGKPSGTAACCCGQVSSLPTNKRLASLWFNTKRTLAAVSVGKMATVVPPAIQMANSAIKKCALFLASMATLAPGAKP